MAEPNQLKIQARREEAAGRYARANELYLRALTQMERGDSLPDPSLLVRVADLEYRLGDEDSALEYYKRAVEDYAEQGLITNAIAVCNKILRVYPHCVECHRRLADLHMDVGLTAEARQNLLRYVDEADQREQAGGVIPALRSFLGRTPDQEIAVELASRLDADGRADEALEVLRSIWDERSRADADVERLERQARELGAEPGGWSAGPEGAGERGEDLGAGLPAGPGEEGFSVDVDEPYADVVADDPAGDEVLESVDGDERDDDEVLEGVDGEDGGDSGDAADAGVAADAGEATEPEDGVDPDDARDAGTPSDDDWPDEPGEGAGDAAAERWRQLRRMREEDAPAAGAAEPPLAPTTAGIEVPGEGTQGIPAHPRGELRLVASYPTRFTEAATGRSPNGDMDSAREGDDGETPAPTGAGETDSERESERIEDTQEAGAMEHGDWETEFADSELGRWDEEDVPEPPEYGGEMDRDESEPAPAGGYSGGREEERQSPRDPGEALGEEAELRRGLELVDELLEVQPDSLELRERRLRYARRLGDREELIDTCLDLAELLAKEDQRRSARVLYRRVLDMDPENQAAEAGLARLDVGELEEKRQSGKRAGAAEGAPMASTPEEQEARRELGMRLWTEFENSIKEMPWLHAATQAYQSAGPEALPPLEAFEMLAHYLMARDRHGDAADVLNRALELSDARDEEMADILYYLGVAYREMGDPGRAEEYFGRLADVDTEFARVRAELPDHPAG